MRTHRKSCSNCTFLRGKDPGRNIRCSRKGDPIELSKQTQEYFYANSGQTPPSDSYRSVAYYANEILALLRQDVAEWQRSGERFDRQHRATLQALAAIARGQQDIARGQKDIAEMQKFACRVKKESLLSYVKSKPLPLACWSKVTKCYFASAAMGVRTNTVAGFDGRYAQLSLLFPSIAFKRRCAAGMPAVLPCIDHFLPAFNEQALRVLVRELAKV